MLQEAVNEVKHIYIPHIVCMYIYIYISSFSPKQLSKSTSPRIFTTIVVYKTKTVDNVLEAHKHVIDVSRSHLKL